VEPESEEYTPRVRFFLHYHTRCNNSITSTGTSPRLACRPARS
jgi:hypothetical protein